MSEPKSAVPRRDWRGPNDRHGRNGRRDAVNPSDDRGVDAPRDEVLSGPRDAAQCDRRDAVHARRDEENGRPRSSQSAQKPQLVSDYPRFITRNYLWLADFKDNQSSRKHQRQQAQGHGFPCLKGNQAQNQRH